MSLQGQTVRIIVHKPENWKKGNLFGTILSDRSGKKLVLKLSNKINDTDILELEPANGKETFKLLEQFYSVMVNGSLKYEGIEENKYFIFGSVTLD